MRNPLLLIFLCSAAAIPASVSAERGQTPLKCLLQSESWVCKTDICADGTKLYSGAPVTLVVNFDKGLVSLNGIQGTIDRSKEPTRVHWRPSIVGSHMITRHMAGDRIYVTLTSTEHRANFACAVAT